MTGRITLDSKVRRTKESQRRLIPDTKIFITQVYIVTQLRVSPAGVEEAEIHFENVKGPFYEWIPVRDLEIV